MPLLRISLLVLLLLPLSLSLSCDTIRPPTDVSEDYKATIRTDLENTGENITTSLQTISCPKKIYRLQNCTSNDVVVVIVSKLHSLSCKMKNLRLPNTDTLAKSVLYSIHCPCPKRPTAEPMARLKTKRMAKRQKRNERKTLRRELCKAKAIVSAMNGCYQMLNSLLATCNQARCEAKKLPVSPM
ncbi:uncharacterized protein LOC115570072 [Sparus aurata]|uniref:Uncharacterized LOC115570072 n=1 Tax=Sparus aurata TaxID=8175 RepID=A0A671VQE8_SPAAU|nr:uncharacterized protein LOC115570072 [Sparus aurata]